MTEHTPSWVRELVARGGMKGKVEFLDAKGRPRRYIDGVAVKIPEGELPGLRKSLQKKTVAAVGPLQKMTASGVKGIQITRGEKLFGVGEDPAKKLAEAMNAAYSPKAKPASKKTVEGLVDRMAALSPTDKAKVMVLRKAATDPNAPGKPPVRKPGEEPKLMGLYGRQVTRQQYLDMGRTLPSKEILIKAGYSPDIYDTPEKDPVGTVASRAAYAVATELDGIAGSAVEGAKLASRVVTQWLLGRKKKGDTRPAGKTKKVEKKATEPEPSSKKVEKKVTEPTKGGPSKSTPESLAVQFKAASEIRDPAKRKAATEEVYGLANDLSLADQDKAIALWAPYQKPYDVPDGTVVSRALGRGLRSAGRSIGDGARDIGFRVGKAATHLKNALVKDASVRISNVVRRWKIAKDTANQMGGTIDVPKEVGNLLRGKGEATSRIVEAWRRKRSQATFALMGSPKK